MLRMVQRIHAYVLQFKKKKFLVKTMVDLKKSDEGGVLTTVSKKTDGSDFKLKDRAD